MAVTSSARSLALVLTGRQSIYRGWWMLAGSVIAMALASGVSFWSFGLYIDPLESQFGWSRAEISLGFSLSLVASGLLSVPIGRWIDVGGPRVVILVGTVLTAASFLLLATVGELWQWYVYLSLNSVFRTMLFLLPFRHCSHAGSAASTAWRSASLAPASPSVASSWCPSCGS